MQHVLRCDYEACRQYLMNLEQAFLLDQGSQGLGALLGHRCDGNRNILHAAVSVCFPVSNKETKEEEDPFLMNVNDEAVCFSEAERSERNTFAERLSAVEAIANAISVVSSNSSGNRTGSSSSRGAAGLGRHESGPSSSDHQDPVSPPIAPPSWVPDPPPMDPGESIYYCSWFKLLPGKVLSTVSTGHHASEKTGTGRLLMQKPRRSSQSQPVRGRDEEQDDIVSADVEEVCSHINISRNNLYY
ncbi:E3 ubiquitin-protein ligase ubr5, partial [Xenoophorus captivus]